jgi:thiol-disulfide isomerase/thioredoxin
LSQAPQSEENAKSILDPASSFRVHLERLNELIRDGGTFSGYERNCAFLNTKDGAFATVSAVTGLDFPDDARAPGIVDWDRDGDLDLWVSNRTAPMLRYLRNESPSINRFVAFKLQGTTANRDAIGARLEVVLRDPNDGPLIKTLHAGEGFLGQSSKWLHFGLGPHGEIASVRVSWPGGDVEEFQGALVNGWFHLVQGRGRVARVERPRPRVPLRRSRLDAPSPAPTGRVVLSARIPVPALRYESFGGAARDVALASGRPTIVNLWASWCAPCLEELAAWSSARDDIRAAGLEIYALSVDELDDVDGSGRDAAAELADQLELPFATGVATAPLYRRLEQVHHWPFQRKFPLPVPTTFLLDGDGHLAAVYHGTVAAGELLADARQLAEDENAFRAAALPFAGRWDARPRPQQPIQTAIQLMDKGDVADAAAFVRRNRELLAPHREFALLATWIGDELVRMNRAPDALAYYEMAADSDPTSLPVMNNLAWQLAANPDPQVRQPEAAIAWAEKAADASGRQNAHILDTLAVAYASAGRFDEAKNVARNAERIARIAGEQQFADAVARRAQLFEARQPYRDPRD